MQKKFLCALAFLFFFGTGFQLDDLYLDTIALLTIFVGAAAVYARNKSIEHLRDVTYGALLTAQFFSFSHSLGALIVWVKHALRPEYGGAPPFSYYGMELPRPFVGVGLAILFIVLGYLSNKVKHLKKTPS